MHINVAVSKMQGGQKTSMTATGSPSNPRRDKARAGIITCGS
jgi:hypothetical protein